MRSFEFVLNGPPVSQQARRRHRVNEWRALVRAEAERVWPSGAAPMQGALTLTILYLYEAVATDIDNIAKPIHDALKGLAYEDDIQVSDAIARRRERHGRFRVENATPVLTEGLSRNREILYVRITPAPAEGLVIFE